MHLELVGIWKISEDSTSSPYRQADAYEGNNGALGLLSPALALDLHLGFNGPNVALSVLIDTDASLLSVRGLKEGGAHSGGSHGEGGGGG